MPCEAIGKRAADVDPEFPMLVLHVHLRRRVIAGGRIDLFYSAESAALGEAGGKLLTHRQAKGRGMLARFFYTMPEDLVGHRKLDPAPVPEFLEHGFQLAVKNLLDMGDLTTGPAMVELSKEAYGLEYQVVWEAISRPNPEMAWPGPFQSSIS